MLSLALVSPAWTALATQAWPFLDGFAVAVSVCLAVAFTLALAFAAEILIATLLALLAALPFLLLTPTGNLILLALFLVHKLSRTPGTPAPPVSTMPHSLQELS